MEILEELLGLRRRRRRESLGGEIAGTVQGVSKFVVGCSCAVLLGVIALVGLLVVGVLDFGGQGVMVVVVLVVGVVAVISLIRSNLSG
jgi:hypothetical protein